MRKHYTDEQVANALVVLKSNAGNYKRTERQTGVSRATLRAWEAGKLKHHDPATVQSAQTETEQRLGDTFERLAIESTQRALEKVREASYLDLLKGAGISTEKMLLVRGRPTSRSESIRISFIAPNALDQLAESVIVETTGRAIE